MKEADIFENWMNTLAEGTWSLPETPEQLTRLKTLMSGELIVGPDGTNATEQLYDLIGDDLLFDRISELAAQDPRANLWDDSIVQARMQELGIQMPENSAPDMDAQPEQPPTEPGMSEADNISTFESLQRMRHLSGMPLEETVLNDSGSTLDYIIKTYQRDIKDFVQNGDMSEHLYDALYDYYQDDMPYGVKKARTGDPYEWVGQRFYDDLQGSDMVDENLGGIVGEAGAGQGNRGKPSGARAYPVRTPNIVQTGQIPSPKITAMALPDPIAMTAIDTAPVKGLDLTRGGPRLDDYDLPMRTINPAPVAGLEVISPSTVKGLDLTQGHQELEEGCNYTMENQYCPMHGLKECWLEEMNQSILDSGSRLIEDLDEGVPSLGAAVRGAGELGGKAANAVKDMITKISPGHPDYPLLQAARKQEQGNMKVWNKRYPETPWNPDSDTDLLKSFNHDLNVQKGFGQFQRDAMPNDSAPTGYTRAQKSKGATIDAQNSMQSNQDLFKRAYGIDEASYMDPQVVDLSSDNEIANAFKLLNQYKNGKADFAANNQRLLDKMTGQGQPATPSFSAPGAAHDGQGGYDYNNEEPDQSDAETARLNRSGTPDTPNDRKMNDADWIMSQNPEEPKGRAHLGQDGYNYQDEEPDQSDAETSRLDRASRSLNYESREGDALLARIKSLALLR
jgi:hypothetical protein